MAPSAKNSEGSLPDWWNIDLYDYLKEMPLRGWVWEFMRRARLKHIFNIRPVDAMMPDPRVSTIPVAARPYYLNWKDYYSGLEPIYFPPAVWHGKRKTLIHGAVHRADGYELEDFSWVWDSIPRHEISLTIDLNRNNKVLISDFKTCLKQLRKEHGKLKLIQSRDSQWSNNKMLQVWDLKDYGIEGPRIVKLCDIAVAKPLDTVKNAYKQAKKYIDEKKWQRLALYCEAKDTGKRTRPGVKDSNRK